MNQQKPGASAAKVAMTLEIDVIPVSDVERSKQFYQLLGWRLDADDAPAKNVRIVSSRLPAQGARFTFARITVASARLGRGGADCLRHQSGS